MTEPVTVCNTHCNTCGTSRCRLVEAPEIRPTRSDLHWMLRELRERPLESLVSFLVLCGGCVGIALVVG